ncbi:hypothetical protein BpHYR1_050800 [Brachionus plicatilis]|uniref:Uncharacterized protein n=1 Tax=Brachionus plicatilis TaxID=10195 RepID=A0A3M7T7F7_BRAPC|nr:hypothetical protein BpHYR1_050800 [Brachionus plicatilis]
MYHNYLLPREQRNFKELPLQIKAKLHEFEEFEEELIQSIRHYLKKSVYLCRYMILLASQRYLKLMITNSRVISATSGLGLDLRLINRKIQITITNISRFVIPFLNPVGSTTSAAAAKVGLPRLRFFPNGLLTEAIGIWQSAIFNFEHTPMTCLQM